MGATLSFITSVSERLIEKMNSTFRGKHFQHGHAVEQLYLFLQTFVTVGLRNWVYCPAIPDEEAGAIQEISNEIQSRRPLTKTCKGATMTAAKEWTINFICLLILRQGLARASEHSHE
jgi:hypothetical protein